MIDGRLNTLRILQSASPLLYMLAQEENLGYMTLNFEKRPKIM